MRWAPRTRASLRQAGSRLLGDFGNWRGSHKYAGLKAIFGRAELCHAKASFIDGGLDTKDHGKRVELAEEAGYAGP